MNTPQASSTATPAVPPTSPTASASVKRMKLHASPQVQQISPMLFSDSVNPYGIERELSTQDLNVEDRANWPASLVQEDGVIVYGHRRIAAVKAAILSGVLDENATVGVIVKSVMSEQERVIAAIAENERRKTPTVYEAMLAFEALVQTGMKNSEAVKHFRKRDGSAQDAAFGSNLQAIRKACEKSSAFEDGVKLIGGEVGHRTLYNLVNASKVDGKLTVEGLEKMAARIQDGSYTAVRDEAPASRASNPSDEGSNEGNEDSNEGDRNANNITGKKLISSGTAFRALAVAQEQIKEAEEGEYDLVSFRAFLKLIGNVFNGTDGYTKHNPKKLLKAFSLASAPGKTAKPSKKEAKEGKES